MKKYFYSCLILLLLPILSVGQKKTNTISKEAKAPLVSYINQLKEDSVLKHAAWSIRVVNTANGEVIAGFNDQMSLLPASNMKVITTGVGLLLLGQDYHFTTNIKYDGNISADSTLVGNLYIVGGGDPSLGSVVFPQTVPDSVFFKWTELVKKAGIKRIAGSIIADPNGVFDDEYRNSSWSWGDIATGYGAGTSGIQFADNLFTIEVVPGTKVGETGAIRLGKQYPPNVVIENRVVTVKADSTTSIDVLSSPYSSRIIVTGTIALNRSKPYSTDAAIPEPSYTCAWYFNEYLNSKGIGTSGNVEVCYADCLNSSKAERFTIGSYSSPPLSEIVKETNKSSNNCYAESIMKIIGYELSGAGSTNAGRKLVIETLKKQQLKLGGVKIVDGSGLSRKDILTTTFICDYLTMMSKSALFDVFNESLPIAGVDGTMKGMLKGTAAYNNVRAKSGSLEGVRSYSGYVTTKSGKKLCFSMLSNGYTCPTSEITKRWENLMKLMAEID